MSDAALFQAMTDLAWHGLKVSLAVRGTDDAHVVIVVTDVETTFWFEYDFDNSEEKEKFLTYASNVRNRPNNSPVPIP